MDSLPRSTAAMPTDSEGYAVPSTLVELDWAIETQDDDLDCDPEHWPPWTDGFVYNDVFFEPAPADRSALCELEDVEEDRMATREEILAVERFEAWRASRDRTGY